MPARIIGSVIAVCKHSEPGLPKQVQGQVKLIADFGVDGDYHAGQTIRHRYLARKDPTRTNHRQVLLTDQRMIMDFARDGIAVKPGQLGENILLSDIGLMRLPVGTRLQIGDAVVELTETRHPCDQLNTEHPNLMEIVTSEKDNPAPFNAGMLGIVIQGGIIRAGDTVIGT